MVLNENFREFLKSFNENGVKYLIVGGYAVAYHGYPRYTKDLDFWIWASPVNAEKIILSIQDFGFGSLGLQADDFLTPNNVIQIGYAPNRIDLITQIEGMDFEQCFAQRQDANFEGVAIHFIHFDDLIQSKMIAGRAKDLVDVEALEKRLRKKK